MNLAHFTFSAGWAKIANVVLAEYHCRYDFREHKVKDIRDGSFPPTRFPSSQGTLIPLNPQEALVLYRPTPMRHQGRRPLPAQQLWLFELVHTAQRKGQRGLRSS